MHLFICLTNPESTIHLNTYIQKADDLLNSLSLCLQPNQRILLLRRNPLHTWAKHCVSRLTRLCLELIINFSHQDIHFLYSTNGSVCV